MPRGWRVAVLVLLAACSTQDEGAPIQPGTTAIPVGVPVQTAVPEAAPPTGSPVLNEATRPAPAPPPTPVPADADALIAEIEQSATLELPADELMQTLGPRFGRWASGMTRLEADGHPEDAVRVADAIVAMRAAIPTFPQDNPDAFARELMRVAGRRVDAAQFFEPVRFYASDDRIMKLYRFSVYEDDKVIRRYYLEHSEMNGPFYVLGMTDDSGHHQIVVYGSEPPSYLRLRTDMVADMHDAFPPVP